MINQNCDGSKPLNKLIMKALQTVKDPEIDSVSIVELGMFENFTIEGGRIAVKLLPTFIGCPALDIIRANVGEALKNIEGITEIDVQFHYHPPWTSDRVTEEGRLKLKEFGIAPPPKKLSDTGEWQVDCPFCGSAFTTIENLFGPAACRSILYCKACKNPFEAMKPISTMM